MDEVIQNLLVNAIKFTREGGNVVINSKKDGNSVIISIKDNGIGITKKGLKRIFEEFYIEDKSRHGHSSGLGLSIAKRIVEKHKGEIWAESKGKGKGSTFFVKLPKNPRGNGKI